MNQNDIHRTPLSDITDTELDMIILQMGTFLSIINNKKVNAAKLLITSVENKYFRGVFQDLAEIDNLQLLVRSIVDRYPNVSRSKIVYNALVSNKNVRETSSKSV